MLKHTKVAKEYIYEKLTLHRSIEINVNIQSLLQPYLYYRFKMVIFRREKKLPNSFGTFSAFLLLYYHVEFDS